MIQRDGAKSLAPSLFYYTFIITIIDIILTISILKNKNKPYSSLHISKENYICAMTITTF